MSLARSLRQIASSCQKLRGLAAETDHHSLSNALQALSRDPMAHASYRYTTRASEQFTSLRFFSSRGPRSPPAREEAIRKRVGDQGLYLIALVVGMVGLTYASVPLYRMFCQATGFGGTVKEGKSVEEKLRRRDEDKNEELEAAAAARTLTVTFNADVSDGMQWKFTPTQRSVKVHPGQSVLAFYTAHNLSNHAITGVSTYNVAPQQVGQYFNKIQCFCFEEQRLLPGERIDMPVFFYIDPEFAVDPRMNGISNLTLSYTFFKVAEEDVEEVLIPPNSASVATAS